MPGLAVDDLLLPTAAVALRLLIAKPLLRAGGPPPTFRIGPERKPAAPPCAREDDGGGLLLDELMAADFGLLSALLSKNGIRHIAHCEQEQGG